MAHTIESSSPALVLGVSYPLSIVSRSTIQKEEPDGSAALAFIVVLAVYLVVGIGIIAAWALWHLS
ncbi:hypothetical protein H7849_15440 [Alloacidobacterium dinghuense]|uniref:Uncharacterized protein n=1 Tax=Alloacidobacterium dinghuense TaxID=2763107 RepID=A0A7G8BDB4_9BACT|nr:hypothetical protein [Alloacidobacterium dinghuense]QNI30534.1 hypothetical protein H7849_15440 [Alloacidobacterium dinghuense]